MATAVTRFDIMLPLIFPDVTNAFLDTLGGITNFQAAGAVGEYNSSIGLIAQYTWVFGLLTSSQLSAANSALLTMNAALGFNVVCWTGAVTLQP